MPHVKPQSLRLKLAIGLLLIGCLAPISWQLLTAFKLNADIAATPNIYWPQRWTTAHYQELFTRRPFLSYLLNSTIVAVTSTSLALGLGAPAAYALARMQLPGEKLILGGVMIVALFPYILLFLGLLEIVQRLGLGNNYLVLIVPYTAINLPLTMLVLRSCFLQLPVDLEDAARVDGYTLWPMLWQIILPMTVPALVTTGILTFIFAWNEFIFALTFITQESMKTVPVAASQLGSASVFEIPYGPIAAATVLGTMPLVALVMVFQRRIISGLTTGAVKG
jgi:multiple sugar transport system permease protein